MNSSLKERLGRLGPVRTISRVPSGSSAVIALTAGNGTAKVRPVEAALALAKHGLTMLRAKRAVEEMLAKGRVVVELPTVASDSELAGELEQAGCIASVVTADAVDVRALRERLGLTQDQFARHYGLDVSAIRNWEVERRKPDPAALSYLRVIERLPMQVSMVLEKALVRADVPNSSQATVPGLRAVALALMEILHPDGGLENRKVIANLPDDRLGNLVTGAEQVVRSYAGKHRS